jgi:hypothetical protein
MSWTISGFAIATSSQRQEQPRTSGAAPGPCPGTKRRQRARRGIVMAGVVESGYGQDLVDRLPHLTRSHLHMLQKPGQVWVREQPLIREVKYLEWSPAGGLRHGTILRREETEMARRVECRLNIPSNPGDGLGQGIQSSDLIRSRDEVQRANQEPLPPS